MKPKLVKKLESDFRKNVTLPELARKKKKLASIRNLHQPIRNDEI